MAYCCAEQAAGEDCCRNQSVNLIDFLGGVIITLFILWLRRFS